MSGTGTSWTPRHVAPTAPPADVWFPPAAGIAGSHPRARAPRIAIGAAQWRSAAIAVGGAVALMYALAAAGLVLLTSGQAGPGDLVRGAFGLVLLGFGGSVALADGTPSAGPLGGDVESIRFSALPSTLTLLGLGWIGAVLVRAATDRARALGALVATATVLVGALIAAGVLCDGPLGAGTSSPAHLSADVAPSVLSGLGWLVLTAAVAMLGFRAALVGPRAERLHDLLAGPARGVATAGVAALLVALLAGLAVGAGQGRFLPVVGGTLLALPTAAWTALMAGIGVPVDLGGGIGVLDGSASFSVAVAARLSPLYWLTPLVAIACLLAGGVAAAARTGGRATTARRDAIGFAAAVPIAMLFVAIALGASSTLTQDGVGVGLSAHSSYGAAVLLGSVAGLVAGGIGHAVGSRRGRSAARRVADRA